MVGLYHTTPTRKFTRGGEGVSPGGSVHISYKATLGSPATSYAPGGAHPSSSCRSSLGPPAPGGAPPFTYSRRRPTTYQLPEALPCHKLPEELPCHQLLEELPCHQLPEELPNHSSQRSSAAGAALPPPACPPGSRSACLSRRLFAKSHACVFSSSTRGTI